MHTREGAKKKKYRQREIHKEKESNEAVAMHFNRFILPR